MFRKRLINSIVLTAVLIGMVTFSNSGGWLSYLMPLVMNVIVVLGLREYFRLLQKKGLYEPELVGYVAGVLLTTCVFVVTKKALYYKLFPESDAVILFFLTTAMFVTQLWNKNENGSRLVNVAVTISGVMYVAWLSSFVFKIIYFPGVDGRYFVFYYLLVTKANDIFAYLFGTFFGRHKLVPRISPNKTIEGAVGGLAGSLAVGIVASGLLKLYFPVTHIIIVGVVIGFFAQIGDLAESLLKRDAGVKDSGSILPGQGGVLDLIDSLLFTAPIMYFYMRIIL